MPVRHLTSARVEDHLHELERTGAAPASVNHVRAKLRTVFFKAKKAGLWVGPNPILETEPRRVPKRVHPTLKADEIAPPGIRPARMAAVHRDRHLRGVAQGRTLRAAEGGCRSRRGCNHSPAFLRPRDHQGRARRRGSHPAGARRIPARGDRPELVGIGVPLARWVDALSRVRPGEVPAAGSGSRRHGRGLRPLLPAL